MLLVFLLPVQPFLPQSVHQSLADKGAGRHHSHHTIMEQLTENVPQFLPKEKILVMRVIFELQFQRNTPMTSSYMQGYLLLCFLEIIMQKGENIQRLPIPSTRKSKRTNIQTGVSQELYLEVETSGGDQGRCRGAVGLGSKSCLKLDVDSELL